MEFAPSEKHPWTTATRSFAVTWPPHVSLPSARRPFQAATLVAANAIGSCVSGLPHITSKSSDEEEKENYLARV